MSSAELREQTVAQLVRFIIAPDGATMNCHYCHVESRVNAQDVPSQILRFQDEHFGCDPSLRPLRRRVDPQVAQAPAAPLADLAADHARGC